MKEMNETKALRSGQSLSSSIADATLRASVWVCISKVGRSRWLCGVCEVEAHSSSARLPKITCRRHGNWRLIDGGCHPGDVKQVAERRYASAWDVSPRLTKPKADSREATAGIEMSTHHELLIPCIFLHKTEETMLVERLAGRSVRRYRYVFDQETVS